MCKEEEQKTNKIILQDFLKCRNDFWQLLENHLRRVQSHPTRHEIQEIPWEEIDRHIFQASWKVSPLRSLPRVIVQQSIQVVQSMCRERGTWVLNGEVFKRQGGGGTWSREGRHEQQTHVYASGGGKIKGRPWRWDRRGLKNRLWVRRAIYWKQCGNQLANSEQWVFGGRVWPAVGRSSSPEVQLHVV